MSVIANLLDTLYARRQAVVIVQAEIDRVAADLVKRKAALDAEVKALETEVKGKAKYVSDPHTLEGQYLQLVWSERRAADLDALEDLLNRYQVPADERAQVITTSGNWAIRARGKGR